MGWEITPPPPPPYWRTSHGSVTLRETARRRRVSHLLTVIWVGVHILPRLENVQRLTYHGPQPLPHVRPGHAWAGGEPLCFAHDTTENHAFPGLCTRHHSQHSRRQSHTTESCLHARMTRPTAINPCNTALTHNYSLLCRTHRLFPTQLVSHPFPSQTLSCTQGYPVLL